MAAFVIAALSMIGIPPTAGFFSKWYLLLGTIEASQWALTAVILISSLLNAVYFFRVIENAYLEPDHGDHDEEHHAEAEGDEAPASMLVPTLIMAAAIIIVGLSSGKIIEGVLDAAVPLAPNQSETRILFALFALKKLVRLTSTPSRRPRKTQRTCYG
jgi:multicomponent Na+:H+ antiporter subunit D